MDCLKGQVGEERGAVSRVAIYKVAIDKFDGLVDQKARGVEVFRQLILLAVGIPVGLIIEGNIRPLLPVIRPGISQCHRTRKTALAGQLAGTRTQVPLAGHIGVVARLFQQGCHGDDIIAQYALVMCIAPLLGRQHFRDVRYTGEVIINTCQQHGARGCTIGCRVVVGKTHPGLSQRG